MQTVGRRAFGRGVVVVLSALGLLAASPACSSSEVELCGDGIEPILQGISVSPAYDSIEKRVGNAVLAQVGSVCNGAESGKCKDEYDALVASNIGTALVVTRGDTASRYAQVTLEMLGGEIDTAAEAGLWVLGFEGVGDQCGSVYELVARPAADGGFEVTRGAAAPGGNCIRTTVLVAKDGSKKRTSGPEECPSDAVLPDAATYIPPAESF